MRKTESLAGVLDRCLARVQSGAATVEDCLRDYPELADQLGPLLRTALRAGDLLAPSGPTAAYRAASEARLLNRLRAAQVVDRGERSRVIDRPAHRRSFAGLGRPRSWKPAYALAGLALALALIGSGLGVAGAAAAALPGDRLYGVKRGLEEASLALSPTAAGDTALLLDFAKARLEEAEALIELGRQQDVPEALAGYERELDLLLAQEGQDAAALTRLGAAFEAHQRILARVLEHAAPQARQAIERTLERTKRGQDQVNEAQHGQGPDRVPPGQRERTPSSDGQNPGQGPDKEKIKTPGPPSHDPKEKDK
ncbi:MAG TPA: DUF5667 domain-containing protein [Anaerolineales bacterium]|jgi:hypothetical protein|nr:DUF5667 domain-containing protein [Anaerolineales bacterium]